MSKTKKILLATYNIQFSKHPKEITENIVEMVQTGVSIFCLQEVLKIPNKLFIVDALLKKLGRNWKAVYHLGNENSELGMGNCIIWDSNVMELIKEKKKYLPKSKSLALHEKIFSWTVAGITSTFQRRIIIGTFKFNNKVLRISNIHLDHNGGLENRKGQLEFFLKLLLKDKTADKEIICGDFNNFDLLKNGKESKMYQEVLGSYFKDISKDSGWTADLNSIDIRSEFTFIQKIIKKMDLHLRRKLDYVWVRNIEKTDCKKLIRNGSDHCPLIATLDI